MPRRTYTFDVTCPASTLPSAPVSVDVSFRSSFVQWVQIIIPDGHAGLTGIALAQAHGQVLPADQGSYIEGNDEEPRFDFDDLLGNGNWQALLYNGDTEPHSWQIRFGVLIPEPSTLPPATSPTDQAALAASLGELGAGTVDVTGTDGLPADLIPPVDLTPPPDLIPPPDAGPPDAGPPDVTPPDGITPPDIGDQTPPPDLTAPADTGLPDGQLPPDQSTGTDTTAGTTGAAAGGTPSAGAGGKARKVTKWVTTYTTEPIYKTIHLPAGGWLPEGARFTLERVDQGQDFITNWRGPVIAPGDGRVIENLSDGPFPDGFGPHYPVVEITDGRWAGGSYYIGHTTSAVNAGQHFKRGAILSHADQGNVQGGGWVELGPRSAIGAGMHGQGAALAGRWGTVAVQVQTGSRRVPHRRLITVTETPPRAPAQTRPPAAGKRHPTGGATLTPPGQRRKSSGKPKPPAPVRRAPGGGGGAIEPARRTPPARPTARPPVRRAPAPPPHHPTPPRRHR